MNGVLPGGCSSGYVASNVAVMQADLNAARARWTANGTLSYSYTYQASNVAFPPPATVLVQGGQVVQPAQGQTVWQLFDELQTTLNTPPSMKCVSQSMTFDPADGHPTGYDFAIHDTSVADGFGGWQVTKFTRL